MGAPNPPRLFDRYIAVDWSGANSPRTGKDSIWIGEAGRDSVNPPTRSEAMRFIADRIRQGGRLFIGFDFAFGYPRGAAKALTGHPRWSALWAAIASAIVDDNSNRSNRFDVAAAFNRQLGDAHYWGHPHQHTYADLAPRRPQRGYSAIPERRLAESFTRGPQPVWKLTGAGAVGSQSLLGIARLERLRHDFPNIAIWPFETGFERDLKPITIAEIYPSLLPVDLAIAPRDRAQVEACIDHYAQLDAAGRLGEFLSAPSGIEQAGLLAEEGWIAGVGHTALLEPLRSAA